MRKLMLFSAALLLMLGSSAFAGSAPNASTQWGTTTGDTSGAFLGSALQASAFGNVAGQVQAGKNLTSSNITNINQTVGNQENTTIYGNNNAVSQSGLVQGSTLQNTNPSITSNNYPK